MLIALTVSKLIESTFLKLSKHYSYLLKAHLYVYEDKLEIVTCSNLYPTDSATLGLFLFVRTIEETTKYGFGKRYYKRKFKLIVIKAYDKADKKLFIYHIPINKLDHIFRHAPLLLTTIGSSLYSEYIVKRKLFFYCPIKSNKRSSSKKRP